MSADPPVQTDETNPLDALIADLAIQYRLSEYKREHIALCEINAAITRMPPDEHEAQFDYVLDELEKKLAQGDDNGALKCGLLREHYEELLKNPARFFLGAKDISQFLSESELNTVQHLLNPKKHPKKLSRKKSQKHATKKKEADTFLTADSTLPNSVIQADNGRMYVLHHKEDLYGENLPNTSAFASGHEGDVRDGYDVETGRHVIIKVGKPYKSRLETWFQYRARSRAHQDAAVNAGFTRPGGYLKRKGGPTRTQTKFYTVQEAVHGERLSDTKTRERLQTPEDFLDLAIAITDALRRFHGRNLCHNDLHPGNILYDFERKRAILLDMGTAQPIVGHKVTRVSPRAFHTNLRLAPPEYQFNTRRRTIQYMKGIPVSRYADVYSLAALFEELYQALPDQKNLPLDITTGIATINRACLAEKPYDRPELWEVQNQLIALRDKITHAKTPSTNIPKPQDDDAVKKDKKKSDGLRYEPGFSRLFYAGVLLATAIAVGVGLALFFAGFPVNMSVGIGIAAGLVLAYGLVQVTALMISQVGKKFLARSIDKGPKPAPAPDPALQKNAPTETPARRVSQASTHAETAKPPPVSPTDIPTPH